MKIRLLKAKHWLIVTLMGMLGLSSCEKPCEKQLDMYGCPEPGFDDTLRVEPMYGVQETLFDKIR